MKNLFKLTFALCAFAVAVTATSCGDDDNNSVSGTVVTFTADGSIDGSDVLTDYADEVVTARYATLAAKSKALYEAVQAIDNDGASEVATMSDACDAWKAARVAWERTEAYLFGPVDDYGIDPGIDSWPLDLASIAESIVDYSSGNLDEDDIQSDGGDLKGFHAIEFLLFNDGSDKTSLTDWDTTYTSGYGLSALSKAEVKTYLTAITKELYRCTTLLVEEWGNVTLAADYIDVSSYVSDGDYYTTFTTAGDSSNSKFKSVEVALSTIIEAAGGIADEVGSVKIADPIKSGNVLDVESWFSHNSVTDFTNNIIGIKEAYYGMQYADDYFNDATRYYEPAANSISEYIKSGDSNLDLIIKSAIDYAIASVNNMEAPFRNYLTWTSQNKAAANSCADLLEALETAQGAINDGYYLLY